MRYMAEANIPEKPEGAEELEKLGLSELVNRTGDIFYFDGDGGSLDDLGIRNGAGSGDWCRCRYRDRHSVGHLVLRADPGCAAAGIVVNSSR